MNIFEKAEELLSDRTMPSTPSKRRRMRAPVPANAQEGGPARRSVDPTWPANTIPIELFEHIMSYLPRSSIQNMRLVNKEFELKASTHLFQVVVVPFKPEIYGVAPDPPLGGIRIAGNDAPTKTILLQDKGMRVFHGFGEKIKKFAMSFEFDEEKLNNPPTKNDQEAITTFWGIYPWPYQRYNRYAQLEGLEQTADETKTMTKALRYISRVQELGLSIDGGLGWLSGPDVNPRVLERDLKPCVFGIPKYVEESKFAPRNSLRAAESPVSSSQRSQRYQDLERMCQAAGYKGKRLDAAVRLMLENDFSPPQPVELPDLVGPSVAERAGSSRGFRSRFPQTIGRGLHRPQATGPVHNNMYNPGLAPPPNLDIPATIVNDLDVDPNDSYDADDDEGELGGFQEIPTRRGHLASLTKARVRLAKVDVTSLKPNELTTAQKEMLLETEWAQRAFMQSYTIAVIDNFAAFAGVETLTIARLPCRHLPMLRREDVWDALPSLSKLSLAMIPEWRDVAKHPAGWVQDVKVTPSLSVAGVYQLLQEHIAHRENITSLHIEWLCGGEYAPGMFSRNQHVMPAPIVAKGVDMIDRKQTPSVLSLPHLKHFSLKNCYATPHIMSRFVLGLKKSGIESITFDSVSLTASINLGTQPLPSQNLHTVIQQIPLPQPPIQQGVHQWGALLPNPPNAGLNLPPPGLFNLNPQIQNNAWFANGVPLANGPALVVQQNIVNAAAALLVVPPGSNSSSDSHGQPTWLNPPRAESWAEIIDGLTPRQTIEQLRNAHELEEEPVALSSTTIRKLDFTSCGYVRLPLEFNQNSVTAPGLSTASDALVIKRMHDLDPLMMKPSDSLLGTIITYMNQTETEALQNVFLLTVGWKNRGTDRDELLLDCEADGIMDAGLGRFDGVITADLSQ